MNLIKTNLVQAQESIQDMYEMEAILESYRSKTYNSVVVPSRMFDNDYPNSPTAILSKPTLIKIDVTKFP